MSELDLLRGLADQISQPPLDALRETARRRSRYRAVVTAVSAAAVAGVVIGVAVLTQDRDERTEQPIEPPRGATTRPVTYADGATIHYGDRSVTAPGPVVELDLTDDGVMFRTDVGEIWFTDGVYMEQVGTLGEPGSAYDEPDYPYATTWGFVVSGNTGSRVAWFEFPQEGRPEVVAYDTRSREDVIRHKLDVKPGSYALLASVTERFTYWYTDPASDDDISVPQARVDLTSGDESPVDQGQYESDLPSPGTPRTMMVSHSEGEPATYRVHDAIGWQFDVTRRGVQPQGPQPLDARDGGSNRRFSFSAPPGYPLAAPNWLTQWVDDDTVVVTVNRAGNDDLLECHFSTRACAVARRLPERVVVPELG